MGKSPILFHTATNNATPNYMVGDHIYFEPQGIFINNNNGEKVNVAVSQNHALLSALNTLVNDRGYVDSKGLSGSVNLNDYVKNAIYKYNDYNAYINSKMSVDGVYRIGTFVVLEGLGNTASQFVIPNFFSSNNSRDIICRYRLADASTDPYTYTWTDWMTILTEEKGSLSLSNGWTNYGNGRSDFGYVKHGNRVFLSGVIKGGASNTFAKLPSNLIPSNAQILYCHSITGNSTSSVRFEIFVNGDVSIATYDTTNAISLDGVSYTI